MLSQDKNFQITRGRITWIMIRSQDLIKPEMMTFVFTTKEIMTNYDLGHDGCNFFVWVVEIEMPRTKRSLDCSKAPQRHTTEHIMDSHVEPSQQDSQETLESGDSVQEMQDTIAMENSIVQTSQANNCDHESVCGGISPEPTSDKNHVVDTGSGEPQYPTLEACRDGFA